MGLLHGILLLHLAVTAGVMINLRRAEAQTINEHCRGRCGNMDIPYPFGIGGGCYLNKKFNITCDESTNPPKAYLRKGNIQVTNISISDGELIVLQLIAKDCYDKNGLQYQDDTLTASLDLSSFTISSTKNKFTAIGCDTYAIIRGFRGEQRYRTGCLSLCDRAGDINYETCSGVGCCQVMSIPPRLNNFTVILRSYSNHTKVWDFNRCSFGVLAEESQFKFSNRSFNEFENKKYFPLVVDWSIGDSPCEKAREFKNSICHLETSECVDSNSSSGYLCRCLPGFTGNPYHPNGCQRYHY
ncbi:wall-associated receptor kinase 2-like [Humulus lupulus]|uniref:wall-associated receptor kinase 2-like n=1 Tax=Humulus lupulus TaxID=3486 RepID=UPI002B41747D|nr:wall-associated receptor kinase 2-like [Humulus lupulus]